MRLAVTNLLGVFSVLLLITHLSTSQLLCYSCQGGPSSTSKCGTVLPTGSIEVCNGENAQCYEALKLYQNGVIRLVERRCWVPPNDSNLTNYCDSSEDPLATFVYCNSCNTSLCNTNTDFVTVTLNHSV